jgi:hypothetical protein
MKYTLMHKKVPVAKIDIDAHNNIILKIIEIYNKDHLPLGVVKDNGQVERTFLSDWWKGRGIPSSRSGLGEALERLHISSIDELPLKGLGLSLSDQYWACPYNSDLEWDKINYFNNVFSSDVGDALFGKDSGGKKLDLMSPDNTSDGWLQKRWVVMDEKRMLIKSGSPPYYQEPINEVIASSLSGRLNIPHVHYSIIMEDDKPFCVCEDFLDSNTELISAWYIKQSEKMSNSRSEYQHYLSCCHKLGIKETEKYLNQMLTVDYLIANTDRHFNNFGVIRNAETLEWIGHAPLYDSGTSLWHNMDTGQIKPDYKIKSKPFRNNHSEQINLVSDFSRVDFSKINDIDEEYESLLINHTVIGKERRDLLCKALKMRVDMVHQIAINNPAASTKLDPQFS